MMKRKKEYVTTVRIQRVEVRTEPDPLAVASVSSDRTFQTPGLLAKIFGPRFSRK
jgi:hypothetical protein